MTDLFKDLVEVNYSKLHKLISKDKLTENIELFKQEMKDVGVSDKSTFIIMGTEKSITGRFFKDYFSDDFLGNKVIYHRHYSSRGQIKNGLRVFGGI